MQKSGISIRNISLIFLCFINLIFCYKYTSRITFYSPFITTSYFVLQVICIFLFEKGILQKYLSEKLFFYILAGYILVNCIFYFLLPSENSHVDRLSMIDSFWDYAFQGLNPYMSKSHLGNYAAPFPMYFLFALPFYLIKATGLYSLLGFVLLILFILKYQRNSTNLLPVLLLFLSASIYWETLTRSSVLIISVLFLIYFYWLLKTNFNNHKYLILTAIIGGLLLSTRIIYGFFFVIVFIFLIKNKLLNFKQSLLWCLIITLTFILTLFPFYLLYKENFLLYNPFRIQSLFVSSYFVIGIGILLTISVGYFAKNHQQLSFGFALVLLFFCSVYFIECILKYGFNNAYIGSVGDISYLLMIIPFLVIFKDDWTNLPLKD